MARIKLVYIGGGSTRAAGTMASFIEKGERFNGSEVVLVDLNEDRLAVVKTLSDKMAACKGLDLTVHATTNREEALRDCDAVLSSYRPGEFEARHLDESIPLRHNVIGQETQGPGGFFMALRSIHVLKSILSDMERLCPKARIFNYTNPVNIVAQAVADHSSTPIVSLCEGPIIFPEWVCGNAGVHDLEVKANMIGLNHACWSTSFTLGGRDPFPILKEGYDRELAKAGGVENRGLKVLRLAIVMESLPADYFYYYYFRDDALAAMRAKPTTRSQDIMAALPGYWAHYREEAEKACPHLDPERSRGGIHELELALDVMAAHYNDTGETLPCNVPNRGALPDFEDHVVVETPAKVDRNWIEPIPQPRLPKKTLALMKALAEYQCLTATAAWEGTRKDAIAALASNPLVLDFDLATTLYDEMAAAHHAFLPERLLR